MLVLTRKVGETIILDDGIEITLMDIQGNHIRINRSGSGLSVPHVSFFLLCGLLMWHGKT